MTRFVNKDVRAVASNLVALGFEHQGDTGGGHPRFVHPDYGTVVLPSTPSDWRWRKNLRAQVANRMGLTVRQLEDRLGVRVSTSGRPRARARASVRQTFLPRIAASGRREKPASASPAVSPAERLREIHEEMDAALARQNLAMPGSAAYRDAMDAIARLRAEKLQIDVDQEAA